MGAVRACYVSREGCPDVLSWIEKIIDRASMMQGIAKKTKENLIKVASRKDIEPETSLLFDDEEKAAIHDEAERIRLSLMRMEGAEVEKLYPSYKETSLDRVVSSATADRLEREVVIFRIDTEYEVLDESILARFIEGSGTRDISDNLFIFKAVEDVYGYKTGDDLILLLNLLFYRAFCADSKPAARIVRFGADRFYLVFEIMPDMKQFYETMKKVKEELDKRLERLKVKSRLGITAAHGEFTDYLAIVSGEKDVPECVLYSEGGIVIKDCNMVKDLKGLIERREAKERKRKEKSGAVLEGLRRDYTPDKVLARPKDERKPVILLLGYPGAGKTTILQKLSGKLHMPGISTGAAIRDFLDSNPEYIVVNNESLGFDMLTEKIRGVEIDTEEGLIFDANPTFPNWKDMFDKFLEENGLFLAKVVYVKADKQTVLDRMMARRRVQDMAEAGTAMMQKRIESHEEKVQPIVDYFRKTGRLLEFDNTVQYAVPEMYILEEKIDALRDELLIEIEKGEGQKEERGVLDGAVIFRFAYGYEGVGGLETYLQQLNRILLERNNMTIIQMYIDERKGMDEIIEEKIGRGRLIKVPVPLKRGERSLNIDGIRNKTAEICDRYRIDLAIMHSLVLRDSGVFAEEIKRRNIPLLVQNHAENDVLEREDVKGLVEAAAGVAGVSNQKVPADIRAGFANLSDAIDTEFFRAENARPLGISFDCPAVILPARPTPMKGHKDIIRAAKYLLDRKGMRIKIIFTLPEEAEGYAGNFVNELKVLAEESGVRDNILFAGYLSQEELRDYYAASDIVVLPSETEGLPRTVLEAGAMEKPVVAYNAGGVPEAILDGITGHIVDKGNIEEFAEVLFRLLSDRGKMAEMGWCGREFVIEKFSPEKLAERHEEFYKRFLPESHADGELKEGVFRESGGYTARQNGKELTIRHFLYRDSRFIQIGSRLYKVKRDVKSIDMRSLLADPLLWLGNAELVDFFGEDAIRDAERERAPPPLMLVEWNEELRKYISEPASIEERLIKDAYERLQDPAIDPVLKAHYSIVVYFFRILSSDEFPVSSLDIVSNISERCVNEFVLALLGTRNVVIPHIVSQQIYRFYDVIRKICELYDVRQIKTEPVNLPDTNLQNVVISRLNSALSYMQDKDIAGFGSIAEINSRFNALFSRDERVKRRINLFVYDGAERTLTINLTKLARERRRESIRRELCVFKKRGPPETNRDRIVVEALAFLCRNRYSDVVNRIVRVLKGWRENWAVDEVLQGISRNYKIDLEDRHEDLLRTLPFGAGRGAWVLGGANIEMALWVKAIFSDMFGEIKIMAGLDRNGTPIIHPDMDFGGKIDKATDCTAEPVIDRYTWKKLSAEIFGRGSLEAGKTVEDLQREYEDGVERTKEAVKKWLLDNNLRVVMFGQVALPEENPVFYPALLKALEEINSGRSQDEKVAAFIRHNYTNKKKEPRHGIKIRTIEPGDPVVVFVESETNAELFKEHYGFMPTVLYQAADFPEIDEMSPVSFSEQIRALPEMRDAVLNFEKRIRDIRDTIDLAGDIIIIQPSRIDMNKRPDSTVVLAKNIQKLENEKALQENRKPRKVRVLFIGTTQRDDQPGGAGKFSDTEKEAYDLVWKTARQGDLDISDRIHFMGFIPQSEVMAGLTFADIVSAPSEHETFGRIPIEAMAMGVPVLYFRDWLYSFNSDDIQVFYGLFGGNRTFTLQHGRTDAVTGRFVPGQAEPYAGEDGIPYMHRVLYKIINNPAEAEEAARTNFYLCRRSMFNMQNLRNFFRLKFISCLDPDAAKPVFKDREVQRQIRGEPLKGQWQNGSPQIMDLGADVRIPSVRELIEEGRIDFRDTAVIKVNTFREKEMFLGNKSRDYYNPIIGICLFLALFLPELYVFAFVCGILFYHLSSQMIYRSAGGKGNIWDYFNIGRFFEIKSAKDFFNIFVGRFKRPNISLGNMSDWQYRRIGGKAGIFLLRAILYPLLALYLISYLFSWNDLFVKLTIAIVTFIMTTAVDIYLNYIWIEKGSESTTIDLSRNIVVRGSGRFADFIRHSWEMFSGMLGKTLLLKNEFADLVLDNGENSERPVIVAKIEGLLFPMRYVLKKEDVGSLAPSDIEALRRQGINLSDGLTIIGIDEGFANIILRDAHGGLMRGYYWLLAERIFGHELAEKVPHTKEHEIKLMRFGRRLQGMLGREPDIERYVKAITHLSIRDRNGTGIGEWQDVFRTRGYFKYMRGRGPIPRYIEKAMAHIQGDNNRNLPRQLYERLRRKIQDVYPYWEPTSEENLLRSILSGDLDFWLVKAMRKGGKIDEDDSIFIRKMDEILEEAAGDLRAEINALIGELPVNESGRLFGDVELKLVELGYCKKAEEITAVLRSIADNIKANKKTGEIALRSAEDYFFVITFEELLGYKKEEIFNEIIAGYFTKKLRGGMFEFWAKSIVIVKYFGGKLSKELGEFIEERLKNRQDGTVTLYERFRLFKAGLDSFFFDVTRRETDNKWINILDINSRQMELLDATGGESPRGIIVQRIESLSEMTPAFKNWLCGIKRHWITVRIGLIVDKLSEEDRRKIAALGIENLILGDSLNEIIGKAETNDIVYLAKKYEIPDLQRQGIRIVEKGRTGLFIELSLCLYLLNYGDIEASYRIFLDELLSAGFISFIDIDELVENAKKCGYIELPKIEKVPEMWNELEDGASFLDVWA